MLYFLHDADNRSCNLRKNSCEFMRFRTKWVKYLHIAQISFTLRLIGNHFSSFLQSRNLHHFSLHPAQREGSADVPVVARGRAR